MNNFTLQALLNGVKAVESSGRYNALGPVTRTGDRAHGAYQVMGANIPQWTRETLGHSMTPQQFLQDQDAQDAVARAKFGSYLQKYGNPQDAISTWFSGKPMSQAGNASDGFNTVPSYVGKVLAQAKETPDAGPMAFAPMAQSTPPGGATNAIQTAFGGPQVTVAQPQSTGATRSDDTWSQLGNVGNGLVGAGAAISSLSANPQISQTLGTMYAQGQRQKLLGDWQTVGTENGQVIERNPQTGEMRFTPIPGYTPTQPAEIKEYEYARDKAGYTGSYTDWVKEKKSDGIEYDPESLKMAGMDWLTNGNPAALKDVPIKQRPEAIKQAREQFKKDTGEYPDPADLALRRGDYKVLQSESAKFGQMLAPTQAAHDRLQADIKIAKERIADLPAELNTHSLPWNKFMQMTTEQLQSSGFDKLAKAREAIYNVERGYTSVQANGLRSGDTVASQKRAEALINSAMSPDTLLGVVGSDGKRSGGLLDFMGESAGRILGNVKSGQERLRQEWKQRAKNFGSGVQQSEDEITADIDKRMTPQPATPPAAASGSGGPLPPPKPGDVKDGYRFKGGDPSKQENWEKQ